MGFQSTRLITFDCYGTLIDWETGMLRSLRKLFSQNGRPISDLELLEQYGEAEAELEAGGYLPYRQVLSETVQEMGRRLGVAISREDARTLPSPCVSGNLSPIPLPLFKRCPGGSNWESSPTWMTICSQPRRRSCRRPLR